MTLPLQFVLNYHRVQRLLSYNRCSHIYALSFVNEECCLLFLLRVMRVLLRIWSACKGGRSRLLLGAEAVSFSSVLFCACRGGVLLFLSLAEEVIGLFFWRGDLGGFHMTVWDERAATQWGGCALCATAVAVMCERACVGFIGLSMCICWVVSSLACDNY